VKESGHPATQAHNSRLLGEVNDRIFEVLVDLDSEDAEFVCECSNLDCIETIQMSMKEYAVLKDQPDRPPLKLPGHPD
jgi:hypothetical protein